MSNMWGLSKIILPQMNIEHIPPQIMAKPCFAKHETTCVGVLCWNIGTQKCLGRSFHEVSRTDRLKRLLKQKWAASETHKRHRIEEVIHIYLYIYICISMYMIYTYCTHYLNEPFESIYIHMRLMPLRFRKLRTRSKTASVPKKRPAPKTAGSRHDTALFIAAAWLLPMVAIHVAATIKTRMDLPGHLRLYLHLDFSGDFGSRIVDVKKVKRFRPWNSITKCNPAKNICINWDSCSWIWCGFQSIR